MKHPPKQGLYDPNNEHENCGMGFIVDMKGRKSHEIIQILNNLSENVYIKGTKKGYLRLQSRSKRIQVVWKINAKKN